MPTNTTSKGRKALLSYVKRNNWNSSFNTNTLRTRLADAGIQPHQMGGIISRALRSGLIERVGSTYSNDPTHNKGLVGVFMRGQASYQ